MSTQYRNQMPAQLRQGTARTPDKLVFVTLPDAAAGAVPSFSQQYPWKLHFLTVTVLDGVGGDAACSLRFLPFTLALPSYSVIGPVTPAGSLRTISYYQGAGLNETLLNGAFVVIGFDPLSAPLPDIIWPGGTTLSLIRAGATTVHSNISLIVELFPL